jgi:nucleoside-diphosphate-sugar epimerase
MVKEEVQSLTGRKIKIAIKNVQDFRNYKVTCDRARMMLGFLPKHSIDDVIASLHQHLEEYGDFSAPEFYNIEVFRRQFAAPALQRRAA